MEKKVIIIIIVVITILLLIGIGVGTYFLLRGDNSVSKVTWNNVINRNPGESNDDWSGRIYDAILGDKIGTRKSKLPYEGGVTTNSSLIDKKNTLSTDDKNKLCANPCQWYYVNNVANRPKVDSAGLCDCARNPPVAF